MSVKAKQIILPLIAALIWGTAFVAQDVCSDRIGAFTFNTLRCFIAFVVLVALGAAIRAVAKKKGKAAEEKTPEEKRASRRRLVVAAVLCGTVLAIASNLQQGGMQAGTDGGKAGFITALYIVLVPIGGLFLGKKASPIFWLGVALAVAGLYLLCVSGSFSLTTGDLLTLACAFAFAVQILLIDHYAPGLDSISLCAAEFLVAGVWSLIGMLLFEKPEAAGIWASLPQVLYVAVFSSGVAYLLQILAQKEGDPAIVSLLFSMEAVFAVIASAIILGQRMNGREYLGCALMLAAVVISQLPQQKPSKKTETGP